MRLACVCSSFLLLLLSSPALAQTTLIRPRFVLAVDNSNSMNNSTGTGNNSCGYARTRINDVGCVIRNATDSIGDATFGLAMFNFGCQAATPHYPNGVSGCGSGTCTAAPGTAPAPRVFPLLPFPFYGCANAGVMVVGAEEGRRYELRSWVDGLWTSCTAIPAVGVLGGPEMTMCMTSPNGALRVETPNTGLVREIYDYLSNNIAGFPSPYVDVDGTGMPDPYAACRPVNVIHLTDGNETCHGGQGAGYGAQNLGCLQVDLNRNGTLEDPIPMSDPNPALRGLFERNRDMNGDGDCYDMGEQRAFRVRTYSVQFEGTVGTTCACDGEIENTGLRGGTSPHTVGCSTAACSGLTGGQRYGYYARSEEEFAAVLSQIVSDSVLVEVCNGLDDDCDGARDEGFMVGAPCTRGVGACERTGILTCLADGSGTQCSVMAGTGSPENNDVQCTNGIDDDCDGNIDCADDDCVTVPACTTSCIPGVEICDGSDNDCDMRIDEGGITRACGSSLGICTPGIETCVEQTPPGSGTPMFAGCTGTTGMPEECNGLDDDCNGVVDDGIPPGGPCGLTEGVCIPGTERCVGGMLACVGTVPAGREVCDCEDNDCDMMIDEEAGGALCPDDSVCTACQCALPCIEDEFGDRCPTGRLPDRSTGTCLCVSPPCSDAACAAMTIERDGEVACAPDSSEVAACVCRGTGCEAPCDGRNCGEGTVCDPLDPNGRCVEDNCRGLGCPDGEICNAATGECEVDRCADVTCGATEACRDGECEASCATLECDDGELCVHGVCTPSECADVTCDTMQVCDDGTCIPNRCDRITCGRGEACNPITGACEMDPCAGLRCPSGQVCNAGECTLRTTVDAGVVDAGEDRVLGAGGCVCRAAPSERGSFGVLFLIAGLFLWYRRRA